MVTMIRIAVLCTAIICALALLIACSKKVASILLSITAAITAIGGFLVYGYSYAVLEDSFALATVKTLIAVFRSFCGGDKLGDIIGAPIFEYDWFHVIFWIIHLLGIFSTASVAITAFGSTLLQNLRLQLRRRSALYIIYGLNENALEFAKDVISRKLACVVFVDYGASSDLILSAKREGAAVKSDGEALGGTVRFLKSIGTTKGRAIHVFALDSNTVLDQEFSRKLLMSFEALNIPRENTALTVIGDEDETSNALLFSAEAYGYGNVFCVNKPYLTARLLLQMAPTYKTIAFDETARATEDFDGLLIGCDGVGQAVLRQIVMNSQFEGSEFHLAVFSPDVEELIGRMSFENTKMLDCYDIQFYSHDGRSKKIYSYLNEHIDTLKYIVLCTGTKSRNMEIAQQMQPFIQRKGRNLPIYQCDHDGVRYFNGPGEMVEQNIYSVDILCSDALDELAIQLNHMYCGSGTALENWANCDYFSRMSSRASADFVPAMIYASGSTKDTWDPKGAVLENLSKTEHLRWCAFHYVMGFAPMSKEEWYARADAYKKQLKETGSSKIRIGKDLTRRVHACLIDWDALDELSEREYSVTGKPVDYKQLDRNNVLAIRNFYKNYK